MIHFGETTEDEVFITHEAATAGVEIENTGSEPLVGCATSAPTRTPNCQKSAITRKRNRQSNHPVPVRLSRYCQQRMQTWPI